MSYDTGRLWIIVYSLAITGILLPFFFLAPVAGFPLSSDQSKQVISLLLPVFLGYLGSGVVFIFNPPPGPLPELTEVNRRMLALLIHGVFAIFATSFLALICAFGIANNKSALPGSGMDFPTFSNGITTILSIMTTVVGAAVIYLFGVRPQERSGAI
jgi:hypothetical protein